MQNDLERFGELKSQLEQGGLEALFQHVHVLAAVLNAEAAPVGWNAAFGASRAAFDAAAAGADWQAALSGARQSAEPVALKLMLAGRPFDCFLVAQPAGRLLFFAEPCSSAEVPDLENLQTELTATRQALEMKQKELQAVLAQADEVSHTDALTFLPNRRSMIAELQRQVIYAERYGTPLSISMIDIDNFKEINDTLGHAVGDQVLRFIASEMRDRIREPDLIGRFGGDEFLVILPNSTANGAADQATRLCQQVAAAPVVAGKDVIKVGMSIGITQFQPNADNWEKLLERADQAMYQAKHNGRGQWAIIKA